MMKIDLNNYSNKQLLEIAGYFLDGKVVVYPTDTIYGIGCLADNRQAVANVFKIKKRAFDKKVILLVKSFCTVHDYFFVSRKQDEYLRKVWAPKSNDLNRLESLPNKDAVSVILKSRKILPDFLENEMGGIAVRIPKNRFLLDLLKKINKPIVSTSLNISGKDNLEDLDNLENYFKIMPDLVVDAGKLKKKKPSKLFDITNIKEVKILRK